MNPAKLLSGLFLSVGITASGCILAPTVPPDPPLTAEQVEAVAECQEAIKKEGAKFVKKKLNKLEKCVDDVLELQLQRENGLITQEEFDAQLAKVREKCLKGFASIQKASTKLVDSIINSCEPVEDLILPSDFTTQYDPLQFQTLSAFLGGPPLESVEQLAGFICVGKELVVDGAVGFEVPRLCELLGLLGPEFVSDTGEGVCLPLIPLDPRCLEVTSPPEIVGNLLRR